MGLTQEHQYHHNRNNYCFTVRKWLASITWNRLLFFPGSHWSLKRSPFSHWIYYSVVGLNWTSELAPVFLQTFDTLLLLFLLSDMHDQNFYSILPSWIQPYSWINGNRAVPSPDINVINKVSQSLYGPTTTSTRPPSFGVQSLCTKRKLWFILVVILTFSL